MKLLCHVDSHIYAKADEGKQEARGYKGESQPGKVARESQNQKHHGTGDIRSHSIKIRLDGSISQPGNNLRQENLHGLQRDTEADFDCDNEPTRRLFEDFERISEVELFIHNGRAVGLHAVVGQILLLLREEMRMRSGLWKIPESEK